MNLPIPPADYWQNVPWFAYLLFVLILSALVSPFMIQLVRGRTAGYASREQAFAASQDRFELARSSLEASLVRERDAARAELERLELIWDAARGALERERDTILAAARDMEDEAHFFRDELFFLVKRFNALFAMFDQLAAGTMIVDRAQAIAKEIDPPPTPRAVATLRDFIKRKAA